MSVLVYISSGVHKIRCQGGLHTALSWVLVWLLWFVLLHDASGFPFYVQYKEDSSVLVYDKYFIQIVNKQTAVPPPITFVYFFTFSHSLSYYLSIFLCWYWKSWGFAAATGGWAVIRD